MFSSMESLDWKSDLFSFFVMSETLLSTYLQSEVDILRNQKAPAFLEHLLGKIREHINKNGKILLVTLTKKSSEEVTNFLVAQGFKAFYLHSEIATIDRWEIIKKLRT